MGLTTTIFGVVNGIVLEPLAFPHAGRLVTICQQYPGATTDWRSISPPNVEDIAARSRAIEAIGIARSWPYHLATIETVGAGLLLRSFVARAAWTPGFDRDHLLTFTLFAPSEKYGGEKGVAELWSRIETDLAALPGVVAVGSASAGPLFGGIENDNVRYDAAGGPARAAARWFDLSPSFFRTLGVPLVRGRDLNEADRIGSPEVALVNETLARRFWPGKTPLGEAPLPLR